MWVHARHKRMRLATLPVRQQVMGWGLLDLLLRVCGCSLLPLLPTTARVLGELLHRVRVLGPAGLAAHPPAVRAAAYRAARTACMLHGVGGARLLGDACMGAAVVELYGWSAHAEGSGSGGAGAGQGYHAQGPAGARVGGAGKRAAKRAKLSGAAEAVEGAEVRGVGQGVCAACTVCHGRAGGMEQAIIL